MEEGDKDKDGEGRIGIIGKIETEEKNVLVGLDLRFLTFLGLEMGSGSFRAEVLLELFTFSDIAADAPPRNFLKVDFKRLTKRKCGKKLTQDTEKDFKEPFSSLVSSISVTFPFKWIFFSRVVRAAKWTRPLASSVAKRPLRKTS